MGRYSDEPPRKDCVLHIPFDYSRGTRFIDTSPQKNDGEAIGNATDAASGLLGEAGLFSDDGDFIDVEGITVEDTWDLLSVSAWGDTDRAVDSTDVNVQFSYNTVSDHTDTVIDYTDDRSITDWQYGAAVYDGSEVRLYFALRDEPPRVVAQTAESGTIDDWELAIHTHGESKMDEARIYDTDLSDDQLTDIWGMAVDHNAVERVRDQWSTDGIPLLDDDNNVKLAGALSESDAEALRILDTILDARQLDFAGGNQLDRLAKLGGILRRDGETDDQLRSRIESRMAAARSGGDFESLLDVAEKAIRTDPTNITITRSGDAAGDVEAPSSDIDDAPLSQSTIESVLNEAALAGHEITVVAV